MTKSLVFAGIVSLLISGGAYAQDSKPVRQYDAERSPISDLAKQYFALKGTYVGVMTAADGRAINIRLSLIPATVAVPNTDSSQIQIIPTLIGRLDVCLQGVCKISDDEPGVVAAITFNESNFDPKTKHLVLSSKDSSTGNLTSLDGIVSDNRVNGTLVSFSAIAYNFDVVKVK